MNKILQGDSWKLVKELPDEYLDSVVTSPPYWGLRDYGVEGQAGLEEHPQLWVDKMVELCELLKPKLKKSGVMFWNIGETYYGGNSMQDEREVKGLHKESCLPGMIRKVKEESNWLQPKQLLGLPWRFAIAMQDKGWILRNAVIWYKPNHMPSSVKDRFSNGYEYVFMFVKSRKYWFDLDAVRIPHQYPADVLRRMRQDDDGIMPFDKNSSDARRSTKNLVDKGQVVHSMHKNRADGLGEPVLNPAGKNCGDVWRPYSVQERVKDWVEVRDLPELKVVAEYLNEARKKVGFTIESFEEVFGSQAPHHWFNAESYPSIEDWWKSKDLLKFDDSFDFRMTHTELKSAEKQNNPEGKNPSDVWKITTKPHPFAHFAVFPEELAERCVKAGCPEWVCKKCGKPRERIVDSVSVATRPALNNKEKGHPFGVSNERFMPVRLGEKWSDCGCNAGFSGGVVLDPFMGSGTVAIVAKRLNRQYLGFELNQKYIDIAERRLAGVKDWKTIKDVESGKQKVLNGTTTGY